MLEPSQRLEWTVLNPEMTLRKVGEADSDGMDAGVAAGPVVGDVDIEAKLPEIEREEQA